MRDRNRLRNILAAGLLTGLVLATIVAFGWQEVRGNDSVPASGTSAQSLQSENEQLRQALDLMQQRETSYQAEIKAANQTIQELQSAAPETAGYRYDEREHEEHDEHENEGWWDND